MVDRQDIDALLISALYGELTPADEARLKTHLDSHPADRTALADLTFAREAVWESRILTVQLEPPQAVSAMLLQEAARRAPKVKVVEEAKESWFQRFVRSFVAHPAMAGAMMLVVVLGVAGTLYVKSDRSQFVERTGPAVETPTATAGAERDDRDTLQQESERLRANAGSSFEATLEDEGKPADQGVEEDSIASDKTATIATGAKGGKADALADPVPEPAKAPAKKQVQRRAGDTYVNVPRPRTEVMDLDDHKAAEATRKLEVTAKEKSAGASMGGTGGADRGESRRFDTSIGMGSPRGSVPGQAAPTTTENQRAPQASPPPPPASAPMPPDDANANTKKGEDPNVAREDATWARAQHTRVVAAVRANNCREATSLAVTLETRAPGYYAQNVQNDRQLKQCVTYINAEREREAERVQRARAQQRQESPKAAKPANADKSR